MSTRKDLNTKLSQRPSYYMNKVYSLAPNCWFHDLLDNGVNADTPRYWHVFVGVNTRYLDAYPLNGKSNKDVKESLTWFINKYHPEKLTSDNEPAFTSKETCKLCSDNNVKLYVVTHSNHSSLSVIDRVIRSLRDMNIPKQYNQQSTDPQFQTFSKSKMNRLMNEYNNKYNSGIRCSPNDMFNDKTKEIEFITRMERYKNKQHGIKDFKLNVGDYVRIRLDKVPLTKHRYNYSFESYKISGKEGSNYILTARDGTTTVKPRYKLVKVDVHVFPWAKSLGNNQGVVEKIVSYNPRSQKYTVKYEHVAKLDEIPASYLRGRFPQRMSQMEKDFFKQHPEQQK